jgi:hypothetical protein
MPANLVDLLYLDSSKAQSVLSQLGHSQTPEISALQLFLQLQNTLQEKNLALELNGSVPAGTSDPAMVREKLGGASFVKATGWSSIEDYDRYKHYADNSNALIEFMGRITVHAMEQSEEFKKAQTELDNVRANMKKETDRNKRATMEARVKAMETRFRAMVAQQTQMQGLPDWMVAGFGQFMESFVKGRVTLRVVPLESIPELNVIGNLKKECFVDGIDPLLAAYGMRPNVQLSVLGILSSVPEKGAPKFDYLAQFKRLAEQNQETKLEQTFRQFFNALEMLEGLMGLSRYPNVTLYPLAVYRKLG